MSVSVRGKVQATVALAVVYLLAGSAETTADVRIGHVVWGPLGGGPKTIPVEVIEVHGVIQPNDVARLATLIHGPGGLIKLNSRGGDVRAAMALGRILRRHSVTVVMGPDDECVSACVFVIAGAVERWPQNVGIHRPFLIRDRATTAQQQKQQDAAIEKLVRSYLAEMNVDVRLYDDMLRISSLHVRYLTQD